MVKVINGIEYDSDDDVDDKAQSEDSSQSVSDNDDFEDVDLSDADSDSEAEQPQTKKHLNLKKEAQEPVHTPEEIETFILETLHHFANEKENGTQTFSSDDLDKYIYESAFNNKQLFDFLQNSSNDDIKKHFSTKSADDIKIFFSDLVNQDSLKNDDDEELSLKGIKLTKENCLKTIGDNINSISPKPFYSNFDREFLCTAATYLAGAIVLGIVIYNLKDNLGKILNSIGNNLDKFISR